MPAVAAERLAQESVAIYLATCVKAGDLDSLSVKGLCSYFPFICTHKTSSSVARQLYVHRRDKKLLPLYTSREIRELYNKIKHILLLYA
jgi:hypothetical protein